jgi:hypothetical protein
LIENALPEMMHFSLSPDRLFYFLQRAWQIAKKEKNNEKIIKVLAICI